MTSRGPALSAIRHGRAAPLRRTPKATAPGPRPVQRAHAWAARFIPSGGCSCLRPVLKVDGVIPVVDGSRQFVAW